MQRRNFSTFSLRAFNNPFCVIAILLFLAGCQSGDLYNVKNFGAAGDGRTLDTPAINRAIDAASAAGGGTVRLPAGNYLSYSVHLRSNITLYLDSGAVIRAAGSPKSGQYDPPEPNPWDHYQDFGHTHWHNSLLWGEDLHDVCIVGPGLIDGKGLSRGDSTKPKSHSSDTQRVVDSLSVDNINALYSQDGEAEKKDKTETSDPYPNPYDTLADGIGNKAIALKNCRNVTIRDISILQGGHFGILATGVNNLTIDNVKIDTNRDGMDIDACQNVRVSNCAVNSPHDDGICLKSSYALGDAIPTKNVTIANCYVTGGYAIGSMLDGTFKRAQSARTGRIKLGTESNGGFINVAISNCVFDDCEGLAIESVDGGPIDGVSATNLVMRDIVGVPIFIRLGNRARGPAAPVATIRHINISDVVCTNLARRFACVISGIPDHPIEDVRISNVRIVYPGDPLARDATTQPAEKETGYPEPTMFGALPAYGFYIRHAADVELANVSISALTPDVRPPFVLEDVDGADLVNVTAPHAQNIPAIVLKAVQHFDAGQSPDISGSIEQR